MFACGHVNRSHRLSDLGVPEYVVWAGGFFDPPGLELGQGLHIFYGLIDVPFLIGVHHELEVVSDLFANQCGASHIVLKVGPYLDFDVGESALFGLFAEPLDFFVGIAEPSGRSGVRRIPLLHQPIYALLLRGGRPPKDVERLFFGQRIGDVGEIDTGHQLFWAHVSQQSPERLALELSVEVPNRVNHRSSGQVNDSFFGPQPAQLAVRGDHLKELAHVSGERFYGFAHHQMRKGLNGRCAELVSAPNGKGQPVTFMACRVIGFENHVGRRVVGVFVHGVGSV